MSRRIEDLLPEAREAAYRARARLMARGIMAEITSTLRTTEEQAALYAQGRRPLEEVNRLRALAGMPPLPQRENTYTVTNCDGVRRKSEHQSGLALDVTPTKNGSAIWPPASDDRWKAIAAAFVAEGFRWGGDWDGDGRTRYDGDEDEVFVDLPHYEFIRRA